MNDFPWGDITEREAVEELVRIIRGLSKDRPSRFVTPEEMDRPLRMFIRRKNPDFDDAHVDHIASNIRGWLGSRYTMLDKISSDYVNVERLLEFIQQFERSETKPYGYRTRIRSA